ncbi:hypothetical protein EMEDMD4_800014 [Sinorhizobium medicae]|uniref:Uncharacterized protein n=1 Tax=Sinorhizobium medicae TaxID=110321 RepID=A0A508X6P6_9HYPH|nr:hypothetical protein EMEDMD4_800014 [Sinorhizobium medicae]
MRPGGKLFENDAIAVVSFTWVLRELGKWAIV